MSSTFQHINLSEQALPGSLTTEVIADGSVTLAKLGTTASIVLQDITYTAINGGTAGNGISIQYIEDGIAGLETVNVTGLAIVVHIGNHTVLGSTATQVQTAVLASVQATLLVNPVITGTASHIQLGTSAIFLTGGTTGGTTGVSSIHADSNPNIMGAVQFISGANIVLSQSGNAITISNGETPITTGNLTEAVSNILTITGGTNAVIGSGTTIDVKQASTSQSGYLSSSDWNIFNGKQNTLTLGTLSDAGTDGITITGGTGAVIGSGTSISQHVADTTHNGYLASSDWNTFSAKQPAGNYITALTGDATASGPGSATITLASSIPHNVNINGANGQLGYFGPDTEISHFGANGNLNIRNTGTNGKITLFTPIGDTVVLDPNSSALIAMNSSSRGFLPSAMTTGQRTSISSPSDGLIVYDTTLHELFEYQNGSWVALSGGGGGTPGGVSGNVQYNNSGAFAGSNDLNFSNQLTLTGDNSFGVFKIVGRASNSAASVGFRSSNVSDGSSGNWAVGVNIPSSSVGDFTIWNAANPSAFPIRLTTDGSVFITAISDNMQLASANITVHGDPGFSLNMESDSFSFIQSLSADGGTLKGAIQFQANSNSLNSVGITSPTYIWLFSDDASLQFPLLSSNTSVTSPLEGMLIGTTDIHSLQYYNGSSWITLGGGSGSPGGSSGSIQFNSSGSFGGDSNLTYATGTLTMGKAPVLPSSSFSASGGSITPDARLGTTVFVTVDANCTLHGPSNPYDGQKIIFRLAQDSTGHSVIFTTGASGEFVFGTDITSFTASGANLIDHVGAIYDSVSDRWDIVSVIQGFPVATVPPPSPIALVQQVEANDSTTPTLTITCAATSVGDLIVIQSALQAGSVITISSITDNVSNTYIQIPEASCNGGDNYTMEMWYAKNCIAGATTITITYSGNATAQAVMNEFSGASTTAPLVSAANVSTTGTPLSPSLTPITTGSVLVSTVGSPSNAAVNSPFIGLNPAFETGETCFAYYLNAALSSTQAVWTPTTSIPYVSNIALFTPEAVPNNSVQLISTDFGQVASSAFADALPNYSFSVWIKMASTPANSFIAGKENNDTGNGGLGFDSPSGNTLQWQQYEPSDAGSYTGVSNGVTLTDNAWHNLVITYDGVAGVLQYLDGVAISNASSSGSPLGTNYASPTIWSLGDGRSVNGTMQALYAYPTVWYTTLSSGNVSTLAAHGTVAGAQAKWLFNEGTGLSAADSSGNGNTLTFNNITAWSSDVPF